MMTKTGLSKGDLLSITKGGWIFIRKPDLTYVNWSLGNSPEQDRRRSRWEFHKETANYRRPKSIVVKLIRK